MPFLIKFVCGILFFRSFVFSAQASHFGLFFGRGHRAQVDCTFVGNELITNGTFDASVAGWIGNLGAWTTVSGSGAARVSPSPVANGVQYFRQSVPTTPGKKYRLTFDFVDSGWLGEVWNIASAHPTGTDVRNDPALATPLISINLGNDLVHDFTATTTSTDISFASEAQPATITVDNVRLKEYSVNNSTAATQSWSNGSYGNCQATACEAGYTLTNGQCISYIVATGGTITIDGNYKVHTFTTSESLVVTAGNGPVEYLVVGGGGGGAGLGGGGAGGFRTGTGYVITPGTYPIQVGAGGNPGGYNFPPAATAGGDSIFATITAVGGGRGNKGNGGSGGGGNNSDITGGNGIVGQGNNGGGGISTFPGLPGGGGGGAGSVGGSAAGATAGSGGDGLLSAISGTPTYYAGGGGGGAYNTGGPGVFTGIAGGAGLGGGGSGSIRTGFDGQANTGGGGGGGGSEGNNIFPGGVGGTGVVIIRYPFQ